MRTTKTLTRLCRCAGWFESSFDAHVIRYISSRCGSFDTGDYTCMHQGTLSDGAYLCAGCSGPLLFAYAPEPFSHGAAHTKAKIPNYGENKNKQSIYLSFFNKTDVNEQWNICRHVFHNSWLCAFLECVHLSPYILHFLFRWQFESVNNKKKKKPQRQKTYLRSCGRWRFRSAWTFVQSDQSSFGAFWIAKDANCLH